MEDTDFVEIPLTKGLVALVDRTDAPAVLAHLWSVQGKGKRSHGLYAQTAWVNDAGRRIPKTLHRFLWQRWGYPATSEIDHINGDGLDNRRCNLRAATRVQNSANKGIGKKNRSGYKGVHWASHANRWRSSITSDGIDHKLGYFDSPEVAAMAFDRAAVRFAGEFAYLNKPSTPTLDALSTDEYRALLAAA